MDVFSCQVYWCQCANNRNFGDVLGPHLLKHIGLTPVWTPVEKSSIVVIGSILEHLPDIYTGTVAGIGVARSTTRRDLTKATVLALRGPRTLQQVKLDGPTPVLADPGLLVANLLDIRPDTKYKVGAIGHYADKTFNPPAGSHIIDVTAPIEEVVREAAKCERIFTSSLHGLITADALGLPRLWAKYPKVQGGGHKFYDYAESLGQKMMAGRWDVAPYGVVQEKQKQLMEVFAKWKNQLYLF